ncbi:MAG: hypothetical protein JKY18_09850 [Flavobacteriales bacterium]|nr:hypothetical protein [Flavobacteriales bacterium]PCH88870.1 MAG: hypothetical protein COB88_02745 [Flavobacteriales bacterium]
MVRLWFSPLIVRDEDKEINRVGCVDITDDGLKIKFMDVPYCACQMMKKLVRVEKCWAEATRNNGYR